MSKLLREGSDYSINKAPRLPICICIDASEDMLGTKLADINDFVSLISEYIMENSECRAKVQLCVVTYGDEPKVVSDFRAVENTQYHLEMIGGQPNLVAALKKCVDLFNERIAVYKSESISHYLPELLLLSGGHSSVDINGIAERLCNAQRNHRLSVMPFKILENDSQILNTLTDDGIVYTDVTDFVKIFECLKSSLEMLSASSATAFSSLKSQAVDWNQFVENR